MVQLRSHPKPFHFGSLTFQTRMFLILSAMILIQVVVLGGFTHKFVGDNLEEQIGRRALHLAQAISLTPQIREGLLSRDSTQIQPLAEAVRVATGARFIVVGDENGVRFSHPLPERIGKKMVGGDNAPALVHGRSYVSKAVGSLGPSMRGKTPIRDLQGNIIGLVSVGYMMDQVKATVGRYQKTVLMVAGLSLVLSMLAAIWITRYFKRAILGLEPEEIARLFEERNATLESVREGIIAINTTGEVTTINKAAVLTLDLPDASHLVGKHIHDVLPGSAMLEVLETGEPQYDCEIMLNNRVIIANRIPLASDNRINGVVSSFRRKDEIDQLTLQLTQIQSYADMLRVQAHEYSNKLSTIAGLIQIGAADEAIDLISRETSGHQELIQFLIKAVPDPVLSGCLLGKYNRAKELGMRLEIDRNSNMAEIPDDLPREHLVTVLGNLLDNAFEASLRSEAETAVINLSMTDLGNDLVFEIEDSGTGIDPVLRDQIFQRGVTSKTESDHGIGLYLVRAVLDQLGGEIIFEDSENGGTHVSVYLPKQRDSIDG